MLSLVLTFVFIALAWFFGNKIRKYFTVTAIVLLVISVLATVLNELPPLKPFYQGMVGLAFIYVVLLTGGFPAKSTIRRKLIGVRKEYSIYGVIALLPHALKYLLAWITGTETFEWWGVLSFVIMIPLFITSFTIIRRKMTPKAWKNLQSFAYIAYFLLFIHLILRYTETVNLIVYVAMISTYIILKTHYIGVALWVNRRLSEKSKAH